MTKDIQHSQSKSLWNYTLSPGWKKQQVQTLKIALKIYGIGKWKKILQSNCLPGKTIGQIYMQTQRLVGQQSLGQFMGLNLNLQKVFNDNMKKKDVTRKNNCIINTGDNPNKQDRKKIIQQNRKKYGLSQQGIRELKLIKQKSKQVCLNLEEIQNDKLSTMEKINYLYNIIKEVEKKLYEIQKNKK